MRRVGGIFFSFTVAVIAVGLLMPRGVCAREKTTVAVGTFADETDRNLSGKATDAVADRFVKLKYFRVLERSRIDQVMKEIAHQQTGLVNDSAVARIGEQLGAQVMVVGSVTGAGYNVERNQWKDSDGNVHVNLTAKANVSMSLRMVDVETGEVVFGRTLVGSASDTVRAGSQPKPADVLLAAAIQNAVRSLHRPIQKEFPLVGYVLKKEGKLIWVDFGSESGIEKGRGVIIYRVGEPLRHPKTGKIIAREKKEIAKDQVSKVGDGYCVINVSKKEAERVRVGDEVHAKPEWFY